jgi:hypothetical protein
MSCNGIIFKLSLVKNGQPFQKVKMRRHTHTNSHIYVYMYVCLYGTYICMYMCIMCRLTHAHRGRMLIK